MIATIETLRKAAKLPPPYVGIHSENGGIVAVKREMLAKLIEGLPDDTKVKVNGNLEIKSGKRTYVLYPLNLHLHRAAYDTPMQERFKQQVEWAERKRKSRQAAQTGKSAEERAARRIREELGKAERRLAKTYAPNPHHAFSLDYSRDYDWSLSQDGRARWLKWSAQKSERRRLGNVVITARRTWTRAFQWQKFYQMAAEAGFVCDQSYDHIPTRGGSKTVGVVSYLDHFYQYCGMAKSPREDRTKWGRRTKEERRAEYVRELRAYCAAKMEVANLRQMLTDVESEEA